MNELLHGIHLLCDSLVIVLKGCGKLSFHLKSLPVDFTKCLCMRKGKTFKYCLTQHPTDKKETEQVSQVWELLYSWEAARNNTCHRISSIVSYLGSYQKCEGEQWRSSIPGHNKEANPWLITLSLNGRAVVFKIDTGADVTVIPTNILKMFLNITLKAPEVQLRVSSSSSLVSLFRKTCSFLMVLST